MNMLIKMSKQGSMVFIASIFFLNPLFAAPTANFQKIKNEWEKSYTLEGEKKYSEAASVVQSILDKSPKSELALLRMGWLNYLQAKYTISENYYHKAIDANNDSIDAKLGLALPLMAEQRWKEAQLYANQVISIDAWNYYGHIRLMTCESGLAQWETLEKHATEFVKRYPTDISGYLFLARAQALLGKKGEAIQNYQETLYRSPTNAEAIKYLKSF